MEDADILHFKGDFPPTKEFYPIDIPKKPTIMTVHGTFFRRGDTNIAQPVCDIKEYLKADVRTFGSPDLNYPEYDGIMTQLPCRRFKNYWKNSEVPIIAHSPIWGSKKGTTILIEACDRLKEKGYKLELDIIKDVPYKECL